MNGLNQPQTFHQANNADVLNCLWMDAGVVGYKLCDRSYDCDRCPFDEALHGHSKPNVVLSDRNVEGAIGLINVQGCEIARNLFYHPGHTWARIEEGGIVRVGLDDFGQRMLGTVYALALPSLNRHVKRGDEACRVTHQSGAIALASPVTGTVLDVNSNLLLRPALINRDPYGEGWTMTIEPADLKTCLRRSMYGEKVRQWLTGEIEKARSLINKIINDERDAIIPTMTDGGLLTREFLHGLSVEQTRRVISSFFPLSAIEEADHKTAILFSQRR
jgi:glycine cleavage system H lipoate-binding protein